MPARTALSEALALISRHRKRLLIGLGLLLVTRAAGFVLPLAAKYALDHAIPARDSTMLVELAMAVIAAGVVEAGAGFALAQLVGIAAQRAITDLRKQVHDHVLRLPISHFDGAQSGALSTRIMRDPEGVRNLIGTGLVQLVGGSLTAIVALAGLLWLNWQLTIAMVVILAAFGGLMAGMFSRLRPVFRQRNEIESQIGGRLTQTLAGIRVVKAFAGEERERAAFAGGVDGLFGMIRQTMTGVSGAMAGASLAIALAAGAVLWLGGGAIARGEMTNGDLLAYVALVALLASPVMQLASIGTQITEAFAGLDRIRELREKVTEDAGDAALAPLGPVSGALRLDGVSFSYNPERKALDDVSLDAAAGSTIALVGPSGSGKSTLVGLIMGFHRPQTGRVLLDGRDLSTIRRTDLRRLLGVVLQDNLLFDGTVAENIAFARPSATAAEIAAAAEAAACDFLGDLPKGIDTMVGERGVKLSGGQRQRVAIARALLADPRILILDEATASLDSAAERQVQVALDRLRRGRTTFVIAHRLSTIRSADVICVLDQGRIVERGRHDELLAMNGLYRRLHDLQAGIEADRFVNPGEELAGAAKLRA
jgi:ABC-type multidrug transport system fused ATPase/permease subunit